MTSSQDTVARSRPREQWADNLRVAVIAGVIVVHTAIAYVVDIPWYYHDERTTSGVWPMILSPPALLGALFALGPLFLVAGWFPPGRWRTGGRVGLCAAGFCAWACRCWWSSFSSIRSPTTWATCGKKTGASSPTWPPRR